MPVMERVKCDFLDDEEIEDTYTVLRCSLRPDEMQEMELPEIFERLRAGDNPQ